jgi:hypothetical protein
MEAAKRLILTQLLNDFRERRLGSVELASSYEGLSVRQMQDACAGAGIDPVEFELALKELEEGNLIGTGPLDVAGGHIGVSGITVLPTIYSRREYACLKEKGYKSALTSPSSLGSRRPAQQPVVNYNNYGQAGAMGHNAVGTINYQQQWNQLNEQSDMGSLADELELLRSELQKRASSRADFQQLGLLAEAEEHAEKHDGSKVMETLAKLRKGAWEIAKGIGTEVAAKAISKAAGLEP